MLECCTNKTCLFTCYSSTAPMTTESHNKKFYILKVFLSSKIIFGQDSIFHPLRQHFVLSVSSYGLVKVPHTVPLTVLPNVSAVTGPGHRPLRLSAHA